ncbi:NAD-dependent deacetylase sirtuin- mitochondrial, partial [Brachionus plicatilis]
MEPIKIGFSDSYTIDDLISDILRRKIKKIVVMAGAGISTPSGIPDFRSPGSGLYNNLNQFDIPYPEAIFELSYFRQNPKPFFTLAKALIPNIEKYRPNKIHYFVKLLQEKKLLHRLYTQNIDGLESLAGIDPKKIIEAHGSFRSAKCINCKTPYSGLYVKNEVLRDKIPHCKYGSCTGVIKPDVVFFGDKLPDNFYDHHENDFQTADCIIVMGTSLEVEPFANIIRGSHFNAPRLLMNRESVGPFKRAKKLDKRKDLQMLGDLLDIIDQFVEKLGWTKEFESLVSKE